MKRENPSRPKGPPLTAPLSPDLSWQDDPRMVNMTGRGDFQAIILGHSPNAPKPEPKKFTSKAARQLSEELGHVDLRNG
jgi:hypothetical protein